MKKHLAYIPLLFALLFCSCGSENNGGEEPQPISNLDKYPELVKACTEWQQGCGAVATGCGDKPTVYVVDTLDDSDAYQPVVGSLRYALKQNGPRLIVFSKSGTIHLTAPIELINGDVTILGQSAPGDGICIADYPLIIKRANNVVIRFMRFRLGRNSLEKYPDQDYDAVSVNDSRNVMLDHCSCSWSVDECVSCYGNENFTLQYCFVTESLRDAGHTKGRHGYGGIWGGKNVTFHHNLLAHHDSRNPRFDHDYVNRLAGPIDYVNNVVYNWGGNSTYGGEGSTKGGGGRKVNMVANYYKPGPASSNRSRLLEAWGGCDNCVEACGGTVVPPTVWMTGNYMFGSTDVTADNWKGVSYKSGASRAACEADSRYAVAASLAAEQTAEQAYETVLQKAGCSHARDAVDARIVEEVRKGTFTYKGSKSSTNGLIDSQQDVGGWPELKTDSTIVDSDGDGMPDEWEVRYGLNPNSSSDRKKVSLVTGYPNIVVYLSDKVKDLYLN